MTPLDGWPSMSQPFVQVDPSLFSAQGGMTCLRRSLAWPISTFTRAGPSQTSLWPGMSQPSTWDNPS